MNQQQFEQMFRQMQGGGQEGSILKREPTLEEIDLFIDRCCDEKGYSKEILAQEIAFRVDRSPIISEYEIEILPLVYKRIGEKL